MTDQPTVDGIRGHMVRTPEQDEAARRYALEAGSIVHADAWTALGIEPTRADLMTLIHRYALARILANASVPSKSGRNVHAIVESHARYERDVADLELAIVALLDRLIPPAAVPPPVVCCDLHNVNCEPPSELCCHACTEATHPNHPAGMYCVLDPDPDFRQALTDAIPELGSPHGGLYFDRRDVARHAVLNLRAAGWAGTQAGPEVQAAARQVIGWLREGRL